MFVFIPQYYHGSVIEGATKGTSVLTVKATDEDMPRTPQGFGDVQYSLAGEHAALFEIDPNTGEIKVSSF